jgi:hypothetical protein
MSVTLEPNAVELIVVHCSATPPHMDIGAEEIRGWHVDGNGWSDIGYHGVIRRDGGWEKGRDLFTRGAHAKGWNASSWGLCLVGGVKTAADPEAEDNFTSEQYATLWRVLDALRDIAPNAEMCGHRDLDSEHQMLKECPSFDVRDAYLEHRLTEF